MGDGRYGHLHTFPVFRPQDFRVAMGRWLGEFILRKNVSKHGQTYFKHIFASNEAFQTHPIIPNLLTNQSCQAWHLSNSSLHFDETCACFFFGGFSWSFGFLFLPCSFDCWTEPIRWWQFSSKTETLFIKFFSLTFRGLLGSTITSLLVIKP